MAAELLLNSVFVIVIVPDTPLIAPASSIEVLFSNEELMIFNSPFAKNKAPPPAAFATRLPMKSQLSKVTFTPTPLLKKTAPPHSGTGAFCWLFYGFLYFAYD